MGATATLATAGLAVEPGEEVTCVVTIRNTGEVVDQFVVDVVGDADAWATAEPATVNLLPQESAEVVIRFAPPRTAEVPSGEVGFGVRVTSREDPYGSVVEEGDIQVGAFSDVAAELVPAKVEASSRAKYEIALDNLGNHPVTLLLRPVDPEDELDFRLERSDVVLPPGTAGFIRMQARPKKKFLRGQPKRHLFRVEVVPSSGQPLTTDGTMVQRQLLPKWLLPALLALLALAVLLVTLWFTVLKPAVRSAAREASAQQAEEVKAVAQKAEDKAAAAAGDSSLAKQDSSKAMEAAGLDPANPQAGPTPGAKQSTTPTEPTDFRVAADAPIDSDAKRFTEFTFTPSDDKKTLVITDLILQNPRGDNGTVRVVRDADGTKSVLLEVGLANFRDLDHHWLQAWRFKPGEKVVFEVSCQNPVDRGNCTPSASFSGRSEG
jgi:hypothetical protein